MAGDWIKLCVDTPDKPEVHSIAETLDIDPDAVLGKLCRVWIWFQNQTENGCAPSATLSLLDRIASATGFGKAMENAGWLDAQNGGLVMPNFDYHNGKPAKTRSLAAIRMQRSRCAPSATKAQPEKRREEKSIGTNVPTPLPPIPAALDSDRFKAAWSDWLQHRREIKKPLKPTTIKAQLKKLEAFGERRAITAIEHSIANGWQGIFEPDERSSSGGRRMTPEEVQKFVCRDD